MDQHIHELALRYYEAHDSAHSLSSAIKLRYSEWDQLANASIDPAGFNDPLLFKASAAPIDLLRKLSNLPTSIDRKAVALRNWWASEHQCFWSNRLISDTLDSGMNPHLREFLLRVRKKCRKILGPAPSSIPVRFGPGATYLRRGNNCTIPDKISCQPEMTEHAWIFARDLIDTSWFRSLSGSLFGGPVSVSCPTVRGNRFTTVPKDAKTDRGIAIEPSLNIAIQLGLGGLMRSRLNRLGLLVDNSQEAHRNLALSASVTGLKATIDLSSASDTVCYELVRAVIPDDWFHLLCAARSPMTELSPDLWVRLEKFSSMGNGFTFELETLIFYAIVSQYSEDVSVFGDDIIVPTNVAKMVIETLKILGFSINRGKTFTDGYFRESCGGDFFHGIDVRSIFLKDLSTWDVPDLFVLHNLFVRSGVRSCSDYVLQLIPKRYRSLGGPTILGDLVLHGVAPTTRLKDSILYYKSLRLLPFRYPLTRWDEGTAVASLLYGIESEGISFRNAPVSYRIGWVARS